MAPGSQVVSFTEATGEYSEGLWHVCQVLSAGSLVQESSSV